MLFSLVYFLVGRVLGTGQRPDEGREIELLVLRHQVRVLQRQVKRPRLRRLDRLLLAAASKAMPRGQWSSFVLRPRDSPPLAPGARPQEVDIQEERPPRPATDRPRGQRPGRPVGPGESPVGLPAHPRRAAEAGHRGLGDDRADDPAPPRLGSGSTPVRPDVDRVPPLASLRHPGLRSVHRGDAPAEDALCRVLHRGLDEASARGGRDGTSRLCVSHAAGQEPNGSRAAHRDQVRLARPRREVLWSVRRGLPDGRSTGHPHPDPGAKGQRLRRAVHKDVRSECLDHVLVYGRRHLDRELRVYVSHSTEQRPHRGLDLATPRGGASSPARHTERRRIHRRDVLGGLIHEYGWAA